MEAFNCSVSRLFNLELFVYGLCLCTLSFSIKLRTREGINNI